MADGVRLSELRVTTSLDASGYVKGATEKAKADEAMAAGAAKADASQKATQRTLSDTNAFDKWMRANDSMYRQQQRSAQQLERLKALYDSGKITLEQYSQAQIVAERNLARFSNAMGQSAASARTSAGALTAVSDGLSLANSALAALGITIGLGALVTFAKNAFVAAAGLGEVAEQLGVSTKALQTYQMIALEAGTSQEELRNGLARLTRTIGEAGEGTKAAVEAFEAYGIAFRNADGSLRSTEAVFLDIAEAARGLKSPAEDAALAVDFFGKTGQKLIPVLNQGKTAITSLGDEYERTNRIVGEDGIAANDRALDALARMNAAWSTLAANLTTKAAPALERIAQFWTRMASGDFSQIDLAQQQRALVSAYEDVAALQTRLNDALGGGGAFKSESARSAVIADLREQIAEAQKEAEKLAGAILLQNGYLEVTAKRWEDVHGAVRRAAKASEDLKPFDLNTLIEPPRNGFELYDKTIEEARRASARVLEIFERDSEKLDDSVRRATERQAERLQREAEKQAELWAEPYKQAARGVFDAINDQYDRLFDGRLDSIGDFFNSFLDIAKSTAAKIATLYTFDALFSGTKIGSLIGFGGTAAAATGGGRGVTGALSTAGSVASAGNFLGIGGGIGSGVAGLVGPGSSGYAGVALAGAMPWIGGAALLGLGLASLFKAKPSNKAAGAELDLVSGSVVTSTAGPPGSAKFSQENLDSVSQAAQSVAAVADRLEQLTGGTVRGKISIVTGDRDKTQVTVGGMTTTVASVDEAVRVISDGLVKSLDGVTADVQAVLDQNVGKPLDDVLGALQKYSDRLAFVRGIDDEILKRTDPAAFALTSLNREFEALRKQADALNVTVEERAKIEQLYALRLTETTNAALDAVAKLNADIDRQILDSRDPGGAQLRRLGDTFRSNLAAGADPAKALELFALSASSILPSIADQQAKIDSDRLASLDDEARTLDGVIARRTRNLSSLAAASDRLLLNRTLSPLSPLDRYAEARRQFDTTAGLARGGDEDAISRLGEAAEAFLTESREINASTEAYGRDFSLVRGALETTRSIEAMALEIDRASLAELQGIRGALSRASAASNDNGAATSSTNALARFSDLQGAFQAYHDAAQGAGVGIEAIYGSAGAKTISSAMAGLYGQISDTGFLTGRHGALSAAASSGIASMAALANDQLGPLTARLKALGVPGFARGGIVTRPTLAMIGEAGGAEAVVPLQGGAIPVKMQAANDRIVETLRVGIQANDAALKRLEDKLGEMNARLSGIEDLAARKKRA